LLEIDILGSGKCFGDYEILSERNVSDKKSKKNKK
jgi:hypothetical protein